MSDNPAREAALASATRKARWRLLPFLIACYFAAYLDRVNIGFAALEMNADLGIGPEAYGFIAGIFFLGYCLFEVPSNILLDRFGARLWIARIMIAWGLVSASMAFVNGPEALAVLRFLLGVAEAGFFPGVVYYLMRWFPARERAAVISLFMAAVPLSSVIGAPISGLILEAFDGLAGYAGWRWLFLIEAAPSIALGIAALFVLKDRPQDAGWMAPEEVEALTNELSAERAAAERLRTYTLAAALTDGRILALGAVCFGIVTGLYGLTFWLPQIVKGFGLGNIETGFLTAVPYVASAAIMTIWGHHSDRTGERRWHVAAPCFLAGASLIAGVTLADPLSALAVLTVASIGIYAALPTFWTLPTSMLTGVAAAGAIALINAIGNVGGFVGPYMIGWMKSAGFGAEAAVASLASALILAGAMVLAIGSTINKPQVRRLTEV